MIKVCLVNLGCSKNRVDSEAVLGLFNDKSNFEIVVDETIADLIIVNTCAFIHDAEDESFDTISYLETLNKKLVVLGCLVEKYRDILHKKFPKVDLFVGFKDFKNLGSLLNNLLNIDDFKQYDIFNRIEEDNEFSIFLKISEGCNHKCGFCIIPNLRGTYYSLPLVDLVNYAKNAVKRGIKEINVIAQDTAYYGKDFKDKNITLSTLLKVLDDIEGIEFIRVYYIYPNELTEEIVQTIKNSKHIVPYFDLPIQHASDRIIKLMNRNDTYESLSNMYDYIKKEIPDAIFRCTLIVGYPTETEEDIEILEKYLNDHPYHHIGVFTYSNEKLAYAYKLNPQIDEQVKIERKDRIMRLAKKLSYELNKKMIGKQYKAIVVGEDNGTYLVRTSFNATDDIDGDIYMKTNKNHKLGDIVEIVITDAFVYDLYSKEI